MCTLYLYVLSGATLRPLLVGRLVPKPSSFVGGAWSPILVLCQDFLRGPYRGTAIQRHELQAPARRGKLDASPSDLARRARPPRDAARRSTQARPHHACNPRPGPRAAAADPRGTASQRGADTHRRSAFASPQPRRRLLAVYVVDGSRLGRPARSVAGDAAHAALARCRALARPRHPQRDPRAAAAAAPRRSNGSRNAAGRIKAQLHGRAPARRGGPCRLRQAGLPRPASDGANAGRAPTLGIERHCRHNPVQLSTVRP